MRIRQHLTLALVLIAASSIGITLLINVPILWNESTHEAFSQLESIASIQEEGVVSILGLYHERIEFAHQLVPVSALLAHMQNSSYDVQSELAPSLENMLSTVSNMVSISVANKSGLIISSTDTSLIGLNVTQEAYFNQAMVNDSVLDQFHYDEPSSKLHLNLASCLMNDSEPIGVVVIDLIPTELTDLFAQYSGLGATGEAMLLMDDGLGNAVVITQPRHVEEPPLALTIPSNHTFDPSLKAIKGYEGTFLNATDYRGAYVFAVTKYIEEVEWGIVVKIDIEEALTNARLVLTTHMIASIISGLIFLAIGYVATSMITRPLKELQITASDISEGVYSSRAGHGPIDELNEVADAFNQMADTLLHHREELEKQVRERTKEYERSNTELEQFAYVISHDLREPLRMVVSYIQLLESRYSDQLDGKAKEYISYAIDGAKRMNQMILDLLAYSRVGREEVKFEDLDSNEVLRQSIQNLKIAIDERGARVEYMGLPNVFACRTHLLAVFQNLISNGIKYNKSETPAVVISATKEGDMVHFIVKDNGIGISAEHHEKIFQIFRKLHSRTEYEGSGIGLSLCKKIIEYHGGRIWVESELGKGAEFHFILPAGENR